MPTAAARAALVLLGLAGASLALAWGPQGHRTVGAIADRLLTPKAQATVAQLLAADRDKFGNPSGRTTLEEVSVWADEISGTPAAHARWHYDNAPVCGTVAEAHFCRDGECGSEQLKRLILVLRDPGASPRERNEALKWVVHLVGDLHQPLHAADNDDRGGNSVQVALAGVKTRGRESLHRAWDNDLVKLALQTRNRQQPPANIDALSSEAQTLVGQAGEGVPDSWVAESNNLARNVPTAIAASPAGQRRRGSSFWTPSTFRTPPRWFASDSCWPEHDLPTCSTRAWAGADLTVLGPTAAPASGGPLASRVRARLSFQAGGP
jgi:hypothetical protein